MNDNNSEHNLDEVDTDEKLLVAYDDETIVWEGRPSQWINFGTFLWWSIFLFGQGVFMLIWDAGLDEDYSEIVDATVSWVCFGIAILSVISILYAFLSVHYEHTTITRNKIKEAKGITSIFRQELFCEISDINDVKSPPAGLLGLVGLSTLVIETNDDDQPIIKIRAIRHRDDLIKKLLPIWRKLKIERKGYFGDR